MDRAMRSAIETRAPAFEHMQAIQTAYDLVRGWPLLDPNEAAYAFLAPVEHQTMEPQLAQVS